MLVYTLSQRLVAFYFGFLFRQLRNILQRLPLTGALEWFFSLWLKPEFSWTSINCFHGFLTCSDREGSLVAERRAKTYQNISGNDGVFNFIYLIKMKDYIVKTTRSLRAE